jgi:hypothetical protein
LDFVFVKLFMIYSFLPQSTWVVYDTKYEYIPLLWGKHNQHVVKSNTTTEGKYWWVLHENYDNKASLIVLK